MSNPVLDYRVAITEDELKAILDSRKMRGLDQEYPRGSFMTSDGLLWYAAEFIHQSRRAKREKKDEARARWDARAGALASLVADEIALTLKSAGPWGTWPCEILRKLADALEGKSPPLWRSGFTEHQREVLSCINDYCGVHGKMPSLIKLRKAFPHLKDATIRNTLDLIASLNLPKESPGRKPKK